MTFWSLAFAIALSPAIAGAQTSHVSLLLDERGVTLDAREATLREVFSEWERVGGMKVLNAEVLGDRRVTLQLTAVGEREALDILLRDLGGYVLGVRSANPGGLSQFGTLVLAAAGTGGPRVPSPVLPAQATVQQVDNVPAFLSTPDEPQPTPDAAVAGVPRLPSSGASTPASLAPGIGTVRSAAAGSSQSELEEELVEGAHASTLVPKELRPPTPYDPTTGPPSDPRRPFGGAGASTPGTIMAPTPGVFGPTVDPRAPARTHP